MNLLDIGIDFGTTNSSIALASASGAVELAQFPSVSGLVEAYRSLLYLDQIKERGFTRIKSWSGPAAIEEYLSAETKGRLIQSLKSFLSSRSLKGTEVFGRKMTLEDLIARILRDLRERAEEQFGGKVESPSWDVRSASSAPRRMTTTASRRNGSGMPSRQRVIHR